MALPTKEIGEPAVFDTCILFDYLRGIKKSREVVRKCSKRYISELTWIELIACLPPEHGRPVKEFIMDNFEVIGIGPRIAEDAVFLQYEKGLSLYNAIIYATAREHWANLITRNTKDLDPSWLDVFVPYEV